MTNERAFIAIENAIEYLDKTMCDCEAYDDAIAILIAAHKANRREHAGR